MNLTKEIERYLPALKTCPWCNRRPTMEPWHGGGKNKVMVSCDGAVCDVAPSVTGETPRVAAMRWNTRRV